MSVHHQTTQAAFLDAAQVLRGPLPEVVSMEPVLEGVPFAHEKTVFDGADGFFAIWAWDAGVFPRVKDKRGSFMYIISGDATIVDEDGNSHGLTADSVLVLPFGWGRKLAYPRDDPQGLPAHDSGASAAGHGGRVRVPADRPRAGRRAAECGGRPGSPTGANTVIFDGPDGRRDIRSREPGQYPWAPDEHRFFAVVLAGDGFLVDVDGTRHELTPGSVIALPSGWSGTWDIRRAFRAFCVRSTPAPPA